MHSPLQVGCHCTSSGASQLLGLLGESVKYQYHSAWPTVMPVLQTAVEVRGGSREMVGVWFGHFVWPCATLLGSW